MAKLIIKGKDYGVNPFILELLDLDSLESKQGIELYDMGPKGSLDSMV